MATYDVQVPRGTKGFGLSLIYRGLDKYPAPETGIFVARVVPGGNSHRAGLQENDKILKINKKLPRDVNDAVNIIKKAGKALVITILRSQPDILDQGDHHNPELNLQQPPLSRTGSARSINTQFAQSSRPQTPFSDSSGDEQEQEDRAQQQYVSQQQVLQQQQIQAQQQQYQQQLDQQQRYEQQQKLQQQRTYEQQLERERQEILEQNRRLQAQQMELQRQRDEWTRQQEIARVQQERLVEHRNSIQKMLNNQDTVTNILGSLGREEFDTLNRRSQSRDVPRKFTDDSSGDEDFGRMRRTKSVDGRKGRRPKSPGSLSGISFHDLSELSAVSKMSRFEEKENMQGLNNRLAGYIDKVRQLQTENSRMTRQVLHIETSQKKELDNIKTLYDSEVNDLKNSIDSLAKNYRDLQSSSDKILQTNRDLKSQVNRRSSDLKTKHDSVLRLKEDLAKLSNKINAAEKEKSRVGEKLNEVLPEVDKIQDKISETVYQLGDLRKVNLDLENQTRKLSEELKTKINTMDTTLKEVKVMKQVEIIELSGKLEREYEDRVQKALAGLREVYENQMKEGRSEYSKKYEQKVKDLQSLLSKEKYKNNSTGQGLEESNMRITALINKVNLLEEERENLNNKLENLGRKVQEQEAVNRKQINMKEEEIQKLLAHLNKQMEDYQNLMHTKTALDMEIAVYRKLVESEEDRLGIDIDRDDASQSLSSSRSSTPGSPLVTTYKNSEETTSRRYAVSQTQL